MNIFLLISIALFFTFIIGKWLEKIHIPWIFAALLFGTGLAFYNPFQSITGSDTFDFLAQLGMYFLLFIVGFEIDLTKLKKKSAFLFNSTFVIILLEALVGTLLIHFVFHSSWFVSILVALSFATVGEEILIPILDKFGIINTRLGQAIIGIGTIDDLIEIAVLIAVTIFIGTQSLRDVFVILASLTVLFLLTITFTKLKPKRHRFVFVKLDTLFLFAMLMLLFFIGIGELAHSAALAALLAGISLRTFVPHERLQYIEQEVKAVSYGLFTPIFLVWIGATMDASYLTQFPLMILLVVVVSNGMKLLGSYIMAHKEFSTRESLLLGFGLSVRFSTSMIIIKILFDNGFIGTDLFSVVIASSIVFTFIIPIIFSNLLVKWGLTKNSGS